MDDTQLKKSDQVIEQLNQQNSSILEEEAITIDDEESMLIVDKWNAFASAFGTSQSTKVRVSSLDTFRPKKIT